MNEHYSFSTDSSSTNG